MASIYPRNGRWHISYYVNGRRVQKSTKIPLEQKKLAEAFRKDIEIKLTRGVLGWEEGPSISIMEAMRKWISSIASKNSSHHTVERYRFVLRNFAKFLKAVFPDVVIIGDITPEVIQEYISSRAAVRHPNTVRYEINILSAWGKFCQKMEWIDFNPLASADSPKKVSAHMRYFSSDEVARIFEAGGPHRDLWEFLYRTGSRIGETSRLKVRDINFSRGIILYPPASTKAKRPDEVDIASKLLPILHRLTDGKKPEDLVFSDAPEWGKGFNILRNDFRAFLADLDPPITGAGLHTWRHSAAAGLVSAGVSLRVVMRFLRHKNIQTTMKYAHLAPDAYRGEVDRMPV